mmetsp:Transcript_95511/g.275167  ORF Transcript_95511/g.275167 Transcript_95511/m.275167 type:complete len:441 (-) Transcript_95511:225-1547(-)
MVKAAGDGGDAGSEMRFQSPPGLEAMIAASANGSTAGSSSGQQPAVGAAPSTDALEALKRSLLQDVDSKVTGKVDELWAKGKHMLVQVQKRQQESNDRLSGEIAKCLEKQKALEADNEQLKQVLLTLSQRLGMLSVAFAGGAGHLATASPGAVTCASTASGRVTTPGTSQASRLDSFLGTPPSVASSAAVGEGPVLAEVPQFPFPASIPPTTTPLSLAEALGPSAPGTPVPTAGLGATPAGTPSTTAAHHHGTPMALSLANSLPAVVPYEVFSFTIRKADETDLGLNVSHQEREKVLCVEGIRADGAVDAWNRQCHGGAFPGKAVKIGDRIISVNSVSYDPEKMLEECKEKRLLRLTIFRGDGPLPELTEGAAAQVANSAAADSARTAKSATSLRADASEFVPRTGPATSPEASEAPATAASAPTSSATSDARTTVNPTS